MPSIKDLFNSKSKDIYKKSGIFINSKGLINPPRLKALALASPNPIAELGSLIAGYALEKTIGPIGTAKRPSDIIFNNNTVLGKPVVSLMGRLSTSPYAQALKIDLPRPGKAYYVKQTPAPYGLAKSIVGAAKSTNPLGTLTTLAKNELMGGSIKSILSKRKDIDDKYGTKYMHVGGKSKPLTKDKKFSEYYPEYDTNGNQIAISERKNSKLSNGQSQWDIINRGILSGRWQKPGDLKTFQTDNKNVNVPYVSFELYGIKEHILLPGTISSLSEDITPTWNTSKYVGSAFNTYRYSGVERSIKFDLKLYANDRFQPPVLKKNLNKLREFCFPDKNIPLVEYANQSGKIIAGYNSNLVFLTIGGYYKQLLGFIDGLSVSVDDGVPWPTYDRGLELDGNTEAPEPAVINVSISMKVIEAVDLEKNTIVYNLTSTEGSKALGSKAFGG